MVNFNGKPYLRIKIRLRVIVWWPFCDFFFINRIPALVKLTSAKRGGHDFFFPSSWKHHENIKIVTFLIGTVQCGDLAVFACYGLRAPKVTQILPRHPFALWGAPPGPSWAKMVLVSFVTRSAVNAFIIATQATSIAIYLQSLAPPQTAPYLYQEEERL